MKILKEMLQNTGLMFVGGMAMFVLLGVVIWEGLKFIGRILIWVINVKLDEKYHKDED